MKIILGLPRKDTYKEDELLKVGWKKTDILADMTMLIIQSVPLMAVGALVPFALLNIYGEYFVSVTNLDLILAVLIGLVLHEMFHLLGVPKLWKAKNLTVGIYSGGTYSYFDEAMSKSRYLAMAFLPFFFLSVLLPLFAGGLKLYSSVIFVLVLFNGVTSALDFHTMIKVMLKVPKHSTLLTNGMEVFYYK